MISFENLIIRSYTKEAIEDEFLLRKIKFTNVFAFAGGCIYLLSTIHNLLNGNEEYALSILLAALLILSTYLFNYLRLYEVAHLVLFGGMLSVPYFNILWTGTVPPGTLISTAYVHIAISAVYAALSSFRQKPVFYTSIALLILLHALVFDQLILKLNPLDPQIDFIKSNYILYKMPAIYSMIGVFFVVFFLKNRLIKHAKEKNRLYEEVIRQKETLETLNESLKNILDDKDLSLNKKLDNISRVSRKTSHNIRGPLSTILAVTEYIKKHPEDKEVIAVAPKLHEAATLMDKEIQKISELLNE